TFVPGIRTRNDINVFLNGIDLDENGTVDVLDANHDGVLDAPIDIYAALYPAYFRVLANGEFGENVTLEIVSITSPAGAALLDGNGTIRVGAPGELKNKTGQLVLRATAEGSSTLFTVPIRFR